MIDNEIRKIEKKIKQLELEKKINKNFESKQQRKQRTRRLIQIGALAEKYFNLKDISIDEIEKIFLDKK